VNAFDALIDAVLALLQQAPAITAGPIGEDVDLDTLGETVTEAISVSLVGSDPQQPTVLLGAPVDWTTTVQVECYARRDGRGPAGRASRALSAAVYQRLMAGNPIGQVIVGADVQAPSLRTERQLLDTRTGITTALYPVSHRTVGHTFNSPAG
jgi:hypothetical protein